MLFNPKIASILAKIYDRPSTFNRALAEAHPVSEEFAFDLLFENCSYEEEQLLSAKYAGKAQFLLLGEEALIVVLPDLVSGKSRIVFVKTFHGEGDLDQLYALIDDYGSTAFIRKAA